METDTKSNCEELGSISSGTLRSEDLLEAFTDCLDTHHKRLEEGAGEHYTKILREAQTLLDRPDEWEDEQYEQASYLINDLLDALNEFAPPYCYFGAHPGDGSDFGFWPCEDSIRDAIHDGELLSVSDLSEVPDDYVGEVLDVNDHGNTSLYYFDRGGSTEIWAIV